MGIWIQEIKTLILLQIHNIFTDKNNQPQYETGAGSRLLGNDEGAGIAVEENVPEG